MKKLLAVLVAAFSIGAYGQQVVFPNITAAPGAPSGSCNAAYLYINSTNGNIYACAAGSWALAGGGGTAITFAGDLSGNSSTQQVVGLESVALDSATVGAPVDQQVLTYSSSAGKYIAQAVTAASTPSTTNTLLSGGGVSYSGSGLAFIVSAATYSIAGTNYSSAQTTVTLVAADPTNPRIDTFYADNAGAVGKITGTPAANPATPSVDPNTQIFLGYGFVPANGTTPTISTESIYLENTEWTCTATANVNCASTSNPYAGTKDIEFTTAAATNNASLVRPSSSVALSNFNILSFQIRNKAAWASAKSLNITWYNGTTVVGSSVALKNGVYGFNQTNTTGYQQIVIPANAFNTGTAVVTRVVFQVAGGGGAIGFYLDNIQLQTTGGGGGSGSGVQTVTASSPIVATSGSNPNVSCPTCAQTIVGGTMTINPGAIGSGACSSAVTSVSVTSGVLANVLTTDNVTVDFNSDPTGVTGFVPSTNGMLAIIKWPTAGGISVKECNNTSASVTPGSITVNVHVYR